MARRTHEQIVEEYAKEYDRIRKQIARMRQRGYTVDGIQPARVPKNDIKARDLERLKKLTNKKIYEKSTYEGFSGEFMKKAEQHERAKKSAATRRKKQKKLPIPPGPDEIGGITPGPDDDIGAGVGPLPPGPDEPTDEEEAALQRMLDIIDQYKESVRKKMNSWAANMMRRVGRKAFAGMIVDAYNDGFIVEWVPPSQQETYSQLVMFTINSYLPPDMPEEEKKESEDEWQDVLDEIEDDEDFLPFD